MACWPCGIPWGPIELEARFRRPPPALRVLAQSRFRPFVICFRAVQIAFSVLTVQGIFTEMHYRTFPGPRLDDQIRTCSAYRRAQPASLSAGCGEHCERDPR